MNKLDREKNAGRQIDLAVIVTLFIFALPTYSQAGSSASKPSGDGKHSINPIDPTQKEKWGNPKKGLKKPPLKGIGIPLNMRKIGGEYSEDPQSGVERHPNTQPEKKIAIPPNLRKIEDDVSLPPPTEEERQSRTPPKRIFVVDPNMPKIPR